MEKGQTFRDVAFLLIGKFRSALRIFLSGLSQLDFDLGSIWCIEDGSDIGRNFPLHSLSRHILTGVLLQVELATLAMDTAEYRFAGSLQLTPAFIQKAPSKIRHT
jgi:hypothetical protein